jgi:hypothetical protein
VQVSGEDDRQAPFRGGSGHVADQPPFPARKMSRISSLSRM